MRYFFTITLKPVMYKLDIDKQLDDSVGEVISRLKTLSSKITLITEITKSYNIHYHGVIDMDTTRRQFHNIFRNNKIIGFIMVNELVCLEKVIAYITKDTAKTYEELNRYPIIMDTIDLISPEMKLGLSRTF